MDKNIAGLREETWDELIRLTNRIIARLWEIHDDLVESNNFQSAEPPIDESVLETNFRIDPYIGFPYTNSYRTKPIVDWDPTGQLNSVTGEEVDLTSRELGYDREHIHFLDLICKGINGRDATNLRSDFQDFADSCPRIVKDEIRGELREVGSFIDLLEIEQGSLIYVPNIQPIVAPRLIVGVQDALIKLIAREPEYLFKISSRQFESLVAELFYKQGYNVHLTKETRDGGYDIVAIQKHMDITTKYLIECKRYAKTRKVAVDLVRQLFGVKTIANANKVILVTTSCFTPEAIRLAKAHFWDLELKDHDDVISWIRRAS
jgi:hypothetical protein